MRLAAVAWVALAVAGCHGQSERTSASPPTGGAPPATQSTDGPAPTTPAIPAWPASGTPDTLACRPRRIPPQPVPGPTPPEVPCWGPVCWEDYPRGATPVAVSAAPDGGAWVAGGGGLVLAATGGAWRALCPPFAASLSTIAARGPDDVWASGAIERDDGDFEHVTFRWDGARWWRDAGGGRLVPLVGVEDGVLLTDRQTSWSWRWDGARLQAEAPIPGWYALDAVGRGRAAWALLWGGAAGPLLAAREPGHWTTLPLPDPGLPPPGTPGGWRPNSLAVDGGGVLWLAGSAPDATDPARAHGVLFRLDAGVWMRAAWADALPPITRIRWSGADLVVVTDDAGLGTTIRVLGRDGAARPVPPIELGPARLVALAQLTGGDVLALAGDVRRLSGGAWRTEVAGIFPAQDVTGRGLHDLWIGGDALWRLRDDGWHHLADADPGPFGGGVFLSLASAGGEVWAAGHAGDSTELLHWTGDRLERDAPPAVLGALSAVPGALWATGLDAAGSALWRRDAAGWRRFDPGFSADVFGSRIPASLGGLWAASADEVWAAAWIEPPLSHASDVSPSLLHLTGGAVSRLAADRALRAVAPGRGELWALRAVAPGRGELWAFGSSRACGGCLEEGGLQRVAGDAVRAVGGPAFSSLAAKADGTLLGIVSSPSKHAGEAAPGLWRLAPGADPGTGWERISRAPGLGSARLHVGPEDGSVWIGAGRLLDVRDDP